MIAPEIVTVIDIETTGLDATTDHITEIAAIRAEVSADGNIREIGRFQTFVALPLDVEIPEMITELTGIRVEDLRGAPSTDRALTALWYFAMDTTTVAHNAPFDLSFISKMYRKIGGNGTAIAPWFVCTRALSRLVDPEESARLADCCARYGLSIAPTRARPPTRSETGDASRASRFRLW